MWVVVEEKKSKSKLLGVGVSQKVPDAYITRNLEKIVLKSIFSTQLLL